MVSSTFVHCIFLLHVCFQELAPLVIMFEVPSSASCQQFIAAPLPSAIQAIQRHYGVGVTIRSEQKPTPPLNALCLPDNGTRQSVVVRGSMNNVNAIIGACAALYELLTGQCSVSFAPDHICTFLLKNCRTRSSCAVLNVFSELSV
jgi:hypothetical protein